MHSSYNFIKKIFAINTSLVIRFNLQTKNLRRNVLVSVGGFFGKGVVLADSQGLFNRKSSIRTYIAG